MSRRRPSAATERDVGRLLMQHYGDGQVYFTTAEDRRLFRVALEWGLVSANGLLTARGRQLAHVVARADDSQSLH